MQLATRLVVYSIECHVHIYTLRDFIIDMYVTCEKQRLVLYIKPYKHLMYFISI